MLGYNHGRGAKAESFAPLGVLIPPQRPGHDPGEGAAQFAREFAAAMVDVDGGRTLPDVAVKDQITDNASLVTGQRQAQ